MARLMTTMHVNRMQIDEYAKRHEHIWQEMKIGLRKYGVTKYCISVDRNTGVLFSFIEVNNLEQYKKFSQTAICKKWWHYMAPIMDTNSDESPAESKLEEVFNL